jgi:hypothetical protein
MNKWTRPVVLTWEGGIPSSCPWDVVPDAQYRDLTMKKWTNMLSRLGGGMQFQFDAKKIRYWDH